MRRVVLALLVGLCCPTAAIQAQSKKKPAPAKPVLRTEAIAIECPNILGDGVTSGERYCDIVTASDVKNGTVIRLPKHRGVAVVSFELHNRQMYSAELVRSGRGYTRALATIAGHHAPRKRNTLDAATCRPRPLEYPITRWSLYRGGACYRDGAARRPDGG